MRIYPQTTANKNVPANSFLICETSAMSGEIVTTYYADKDGHLFKVTDWKGNKPVQAYLPELWKLTGDTPNMIFGRLTSHFKAARSP